MRIVFAISSVFVRVIQKSLQNLRISCTTLVYYLLHYLHVTISFLFKHSEMLSTRMFRTATRIISRRFLSSQRSMVDLNVDNEGIATLIMQRPPVNGLNLEFLQELIVALDDVEKNKFKGLVITSASPTVFSAGIDIVEFCNPNVDRLSKFWTTLQDFWLKLFTAPYPTAAAINGHAPAGGCLIGITSEYRTMVNGKYSIGLNETVVGIPAPRWLSDTMCLVIPWRLADIALTTGRMFSVEEALQVGLIHETASDKAEAIEKSKNFIRKFDKILPIAFNRTKLRCRATTVETFLRTRETDLNEFMEVCLQPQVQDKLQLYLEMVKQKSSAKVKK